MCAANAPLSCDRGAHGQFDACSRERSVELRLRRRRPWMAAAAAAAAALAGWRATSA
jgi:hypothetical protein